MSVGPHLLGRVPSTPDERDYKMAHFLKAETPLDILLGKVLSSHLVPKVLKTLCQAIVSAIEGVVPNPDPPAPPSGPVDWQCNVILDQGDTPHCVGFGWADWGNTAPVQDSFGNGDGDAIYYQCKILDNEPKAEDGSTVRSGAQVMQSRGKLKTYVFAETVDDVKQWILNKGPVVAGTDWHQSMFYPDPGGNINIAGPVEGGHCYLLLGYNPYKDTFECLNSWGNGWGAGGRFFLKAADFATLMAAGGEACAAAELA